jgi:precorrin-2 dehydrogenase / sirohydrochlorin ferrochelatase
MRYLPIELDVAGREALVVGVSAEALSKVDRLIDAGAKVTVIAERAPGPELLSRAAGGRIALIEREATPTSTAG